MDFFDLFVRAFAVANMAYKWNFFPNFVGNPLTRFDYEYIEAVRLSTMKEF